MIKQEIIDLNHQEKLKCRVCGKEFSNKNPYQIYKNERSLTNSIKKDNQRIKITTVEEYEEIYLCWNYSKECIIKYLKESNIIEPRKVEYVYTEETKERYKKTYKEIEEKLNSLKLAEEYTFCKNDREVKVQKLGDSNKYEFILNSLKSSYDFQKNSESAAEEITTYLELNE